MAADEKKEDRLPVEVRAKMLSNETSIYFNMAKFEHAQRLSSMFAASTMVPDHFRNNVGNCLIALNYADRLQADPFMVMQSMYVVHGRPGIEAKLMIALINQSGKYAEPLKFKFDGTGEEYGCTAYTREAKSGEVVEGPKVNWKMVKAEGWDSKNGSKWKTIPDLMFRYRAASWFSNVHCPELKLGMSTVEEIHDFVDLQEKRKGSWEAPEPEVDPAATIEAEKRFCAAFADELAGEPERFQRFLDETRKTYGMSDAEAKAKFVDQAADVKAGFQSWVARTFQEPADHDPNKPDSGNVKQKRTRKPKQDDPQATAADPEASEIEAVKRKLDEYGRDHLSYVLQAKRNTGIAHPSTLDGATRILDEVERLLAERPPK